MERYSSTRKYFESQQSDEEVILVVRKHPLSVLPAFLLSGLGYIIGLVMLFVFPFAFPVLVSGFVYNVYILVVSIIFILNTAILFRSWVLHYLHVAILTDSHFVEISQSGMFSRKISQMTLDKIQDVSSNQKGMTDTMFNLGTVEVQSAGELPNFIIEYVPDPNAIARKIMEVQEDYCQKFGLHGDGINNNANMVNSELSGYLDDNHVNANGPKIEYPDGKF